MLRKNEEMNLKNELDELVIARARFKRETIRKIRVMDKEIDTKLSIYNQIQPYISKLNQILTDSYDDRWVANMVIQKKQTLTSSEYHQLMEKLNLFLQQIDDLRFVVPTELHPDAAEIDNQIEHEFAIFNDLIKQLVLIQNPDKFSKKRHRSHVSFTRTSKRRRLHESSDDSSDDSSII